MAARMVEQVLPLALRRVNVPFELQVSREEEWSVWHQYDGQRARLGLWSKTLPDPAA